MSLGCRHVPRHVPHLMLSACVSVWTAVAGGWRGAGARRRGVFGGGVLGLTSDALKSSQVANVSHAITCIDPLVPRPVMYMQLLVRRLASSYPCAFAPRVPPTEILSLYFSTESCRSAVEIRSSIKKNPDGKSMITLHDPDLASRSLEPEPRHLTQYFTLSSEVILRITSLLEELDSLHGQLDSLRPHNEVWQDLSGLERRDYAARIEALCDRIHSTERKLEELNRLHCIR